MILKQKSLKPWGYSTSYAHQEDLSIFYNNSFCICWEISLKTDQQTEIATETHLSKKKTKLQNTKLLHFP